MTGAVTLAVVTYRRPLELARLLARVAREVEAIGAEVLVVDNDPAGSARDAVARAPMPARFVIEERPGIVAARNRALSEASGALVAFTDDDTLPGRGWLQALVTRQAASGADVVTGPVRHRFAGPPPRWAGGAHCFQERRPRSTDPSHWPATNNVLLRKAVFDETGVSFDPRFTSAGSDTHLFRRLGRAGASFAWADEALVEEVVPAGRATVAWALRRSFRMANTVSLCDRDIEGASGLPVRRAARWTWWGARALAAGTVRRDPEGLVRGLSSMAWAGGLLAGATGYRYREYRRG